MEEIRLKLKETILSLLDTKEQKNLEIAVPLIDRYFAIEKLDAHCTPSKRKTCIENSISEYNSFIKNNANERFNL